LNHLTKKVQIEFLMHWLLTQSSLPKKFHLSLVTPDAALPTFDQITKKGNESEDEDDES
jgi:hypothetical protein